MRRLLLVLMLTATVGCTRPAPTGNPAPGKTVGEEPAVPAAEEGREVSKNPMVAANQVTKAAQEMADLMKELEGRKPVDPVHFSKLIELLPPAPAGFEADEPRGETTDAGEFKFSTAERRYQGDGKELTVKLTDGAHVPFLYAGVAMASKFKRETTEGYEKGLKLGDSFGVEKYQKADKRGELNLVVEKRFLVDIQATGVPPEFVRTVYGKLDTKKLAALK